MTTHPSPTNPTLPAEALTCGLAHVALSSLANPPAVEAELAPLAGAEELA